MSESGKDKAMKWVIMAEGGYVNNRHDPGGETKYGISKRAYPDTDIKNLTEQGAIAIYEKDYWHVRGIDLLPYPLDCAVFDMGVNSGQPVAVKILQCLIDTTSDGVIGQITLGKSARMMLKN